jgi:hypothetical protein
MRKTGGRRVALLVLGILVLGAIAILLQNQDSSSEARRFRVVKTTSHTWPLCRVEGGEGKVRLIVDGVNYSVDPKKIFLMSKCQEGRVRWFTLFKVTKYRTTLKIESRSTRGNLKRAREFADAHSNDPLTPEGLLRHPTHDNERWSNFLGRSDEGKIIGIGCTDKRSTPEHYCQAVTEIEGGTKMRYGFDLKFFSDWRNVDHAIRSYVERLKAPGGTK